jgi:phosphonate transport system permease protein
MTALSTPAQRGQRPARPRTWWKPVLVLAIVVGATAWASAAVGTDPSALWRNGHNAVNTLTQLFQPDYSFFPQTLDALGETVQMAVIGTAIGVALSLPLSFLASRATNPERISYRVVRFVMNVVRAVPDLLYASIFVTVIGTGALSGIVALVLFNLGIMVKLISEALDGIDRGGQEAALASGSTWFGANRVAVLPEISPAFLSQTIYVLELNIRASTVIGLVGAGGLGMLIDKVRTFYEYHYLALIIFEILVLVLALDLLSSYVRSKVVR